MSVSPTTYEFVHEGQTLVARKVSYNKCWDIYDLDNVYVESIVVNDPNQSIEEAVEARLKVGLHYTWNQ